MGTFYRSKSLIDRIRCRALGVTAVSIFVFVKVKVSLYHTILNQKILAADS